MLNRLISKGPFHLTLKRFRGMHSVLKSRSFTSVYHKIIPEVSYIKYFFINVASANLGINITQPGLDLDYQL